MTAKDKAIRLFTIMYGEFENGISHKEAKRCALIAVDYIINSNPHSNPFNTDVFSTMLFWQDVKQELLNL